MRTSSASGTEFLSVRSNADLVAPASCLDEEKY